VTRALISSENSLLRNVAGVAFAMLAIPIVIVVKLIVTPFAKPTSRAADEVAHLLRDFHDGTGDGYDWDDFVSVPIADPRLESIRERAWALNLPVDAKGFGELKLLLEEAEAIVQAENVSPVNGS
jgi:hypothetical protein